MRRHVLIGADTQGESVKVFTGSLQVQGKDEYETYFFLKVDSEL